MIIKKQINNNNNNNNRDSKKRSDIAIVRLEEITPFPYEQLKEETNKYQNATQHVWIQEEPQNMGAWSFVEVNHFFIVI